MNQWVSVYFTSWWTNSDIDKDPPIEFQAQPKSFELSTDVKVAWAAY